MEFFDFTGTNEEEKAQVLDIISNHSEAVEFFDEYQDETGDSKLYSHLNGGGVLMNQFENGLDLSDTQSSSYSPEVHTVPVSTNQPAAPPPQSNWSTNNNTSNSVVMTNSVPFQLNGGGGGTSDPVVCASPHYLFHSNAPPYYAHTGPHNPIYAPIPHHTLTMAPPPPPPPHSVNRSGKDYKSFRMSSSCHNNPPPAAMKNLPKIANTNCDIRSSFYGPPSQYSDTQMLDTNHLPATSMPVSIENGAVISGDPMNGSGVHPAYSAYGFPHTAALFPPAPFTTPVYIITHEGQFFQYAPFAPNTVPTHISPHQSVPIIPSNNNMSDLCGSNQISSTTNTTSAQSSATATLSNLSSSISASSTSIAAAYHSSPSSHSGTPTSFEPAEESNLYSKLNNITVCDSKCNEENVNTDVNKSDNQAATSQPKVNSPPLVPSSSKHCEPATKANPTSNAVSNYKNTFPSLKNVETSNEKKSNNETVVSSPNAVDKLLSKLQSIQIANETAESVEAPQHIDSLLSTNKNSSQTAQVSQPNPATTTDGSIDPTDSTQDSSLLYVGNVINDNTPSPATTSNDSNKSASSTWASKLFGSATNPIDASQSRKTESSHNEVAKLSNGDSEPTINSKSSNIVNYNSRNRLNFDDSSKLKVVPTKEDPLAFKLAKRLRDSIHLKHSLPAIMPCGLINRGNWCYVNATLQALLACPPFYNLMREISETPGLFRQVTSTPIIDNFARYFSKFLPSDFKRQLKSAGASLNSYLEELLNNEPLEPLSIYDTLNHIGMIKNDAQRGLQEDAEEFLSSVLNGINEEMVQLSKLLNENNDAQVNGNGDLNDSSANEQGLSDSDENIWRLVGNSKFKSLPTRSTDAANTAITEIFGGTRLDVRTVNNDKDFSAYRQPFFTLQLDIKPKSINNLDDAIRYQTRSQTIQDYTCSKTKQIVDACSQMFLETLPPILILHLKLFEYDFETGVERKLRKRIEFSENFEIPRECISSKDNRSCRRYKLLAVVYHSGPEAVKGHYITDVYHLGLNQWLRCDDSSIKVISINKVLSGGEGNLVPYLLFYRRYDTLYLNNSSASGATGNSASLITGANISSTGGGGKYRATSANNEYAINSNTNHYSHNNNQHHQHHHQPSHHSTQQQQQHSEAINTSNKYSSISIQH